MKKIDAQLDELYQFDVARFEQNSLLLEERILKQVATVPQKALYKVSQEVPHKTPRKSRFHWGWFYSAVAVAVVVVAFGIQGLVVSSVQNTTELTQFEQEWQWLMVEQDMAMLSDFIQSS